MFVAFRFLFSTATIRFDEWRSLTWNQRYGRILLANLYVLGCAAVPNFVAALVEVISNPSTANEWYAGVTLFELVGGFIMFRFYRPKDDRANEPSRCPCTERRIRLALVTNL